MISIVICMITIATSFGLISCDIAESINNSVVYPESYSITYEITSADGVITTVTKTVDANGNVYINNANEEKLYIKENNTYYLYKKDENGIFTTLGYIKYTKEAVDKATADITKYSEESKNQFVPTAKLDGESTVAGRRCNIYKLGVGGDNNNAYYYYHIDAETGICLELEVSMTALGSSVEYDGETFICTEFITDNIDDLSILISK